MTDNGSDLNNAMRLQKDYYFWLSKIRIIVIENSEIKVKNINGGVTPGIINYIIVCKPITSC